MMQDTLVRNAKIMFNERVASDATEYGRVVSKNVAAARGRLTPLKQSDVAARMRNLGYSSWRQQTVGSVERGERRLTAEEILGLALALETSVPALLRPSEDDKLVALPGGQAMSTLWLRRLVGVGTNDGGVTWKGVDPVFTDPARAPQYQVAVYDVVPPSHLAYDDGSPVEDAPYASKWRPDHLGKRGEDE